VSSEVDWVLQRIDDYYGYGAFPYGGSGYGSAPPLKRVDRDDSEILEDNIRSRTGELQEANFVGATLASQAPTPIGTEYDHAIETTVGLRIEGLHVDEWGYVDPDGQDAPPFQHLTTAIRDALLTARTYPAAGRSGVDYHTLFFENSSPQSSDWEDYYRFDVDVVFRGYETLP